MRKFFNFVKWTMITAVVLIAISITGFYMVRPHDNGDKVDSYTTNVHFLTPNDTIDIESFDDPDIKGVTCYLSRPKTGGWSGMVGIAEDASDGSLGCDKTGQISYNPDDIKGSKESVFEASTSVFFKTMTVSRSYDPKHNVVIYLVHARKILSGSPKNNIFVLALK